MLKQVYSISLEIVPMLVLSKYELQNGGSPRLSVLQELIHDKNVS